MAVTAIVASGKGGVGKSTVTAMLGEALAFSGKRVLLVELDSGLRTLDAALGLSKDIVFDLGDVARGSSGLPEAVYPCGFCRGLSLIAAAARPVLIPADTLCAITRELSGAFDYILMDCPAGMGGEPQEAGRAADIALIVATPDPVSIKGARAASEAAEACGVREQRLIINRCPPKPRMLPPLTGLDEVIDGVGVQLLGVLWDDAETRLALSGGRALPPSSKNAAPFSNIARRLGGEHIPLVMK